MTEREEALRALREALRHAPDNVPLRLDLADALLARGRPGEAEQEYRRGLTLAPQHLGLKLGLALAFFEQGKDSPALVVVEDLLKRPHTPAAAYLLHARLLLQTGNPERAARQYREAVDADPDLADPHLEQQLGILRETSDGTVHEDGESDLNPTIERPSTENRPPLTFADVGGMDEIKEEVRCRIIHALAHPALYAAYGQSIGGGILMYGPPGCGKTYLARATAGEVGAGFVSVGIHDVLDMWVGQSERNLHAIFERARASRPCVLFFDEVDAVGACRTDWRSGTRRQMINQLLAEMDGVDASNEGVLVLAATNAPWHLDPAFRRPGRFDRVVFVAPPDYLGRIAILRVLCRDKPVDGIDYDQAARKTDGFSGADLKAVVDLAVRARLREAIRDGLPAPLTTRDLLAAAALVRPSTREWFATARNYALYANEGGAYDEILKYLKK